MKSTNPTHATFLFGGKSEIKKASELAASSLYTKLRNMIYRSTLPVMVFLPFLASWNIFFTTNVAAQILGTTEGGQLAYFTTPQFTDGDSHRQDVCERYFALNNGTVRLEDVLRG